ncbi:MAG: hypothetical protein ABEN55_19080 [Bradymonadaceae bacterium]
MLETCGDYAREAEWPDRADQFWRLARELYEEFGDEEAADSVARHMSDN